MKKSKEEFAIKVTNIFSECHNFSKTRSRFSEEYSDDSVPSVRTIIRILLCGPYMKNKSEDEYIKAKDQLILQYVDEVSSKISIARIALWFSVTKEHVSKLFYGQNQATSRIQLKNTMDTDGCLETMESNRGGKKRGQKLIPVLRNELDSNKFPVIYTTRLDDMNAISLNVDINNIQQFTDRIYAESKPAFDGTIWRATANEVRSYSYEILENKIGELSHSSQRQNYNSSSDSEDTVTSSETENDPSLLRDILLSYTKTKMSGTKSNERRNKKDSSQSKHIDQFVCNETTNEVIIIKEEVCIDYEPENVNTNRISEDGMVKKIQEKDEVEEIHGDSTTNRTSVKKLQKIAKEQCLSKNIIISIKDMQYKEINIYRIDEEEVISEFYRSNDYNCDVGSLILKQFGRVNNKILKLNVCCWGHHMAVIKTIWPAINTQSLKFAKPLHRCSIGDCSCCCIFDTFKFYVDTFEPDKAKVECPFTSKETLCNIRTICDENKTIAKALNYKPIKKVNPCITYLPNDLPLLTEKVVKSLNIETKLKGDDEANLKELYVIDTKGEICSRQVTKSHKAIGTQASKLACCGYSRHATINNLAGIEPRTMKYLLRLDRFNEICELCAKNKVKATKKPLKPPNISTRSNVQTLVQHSFGVYGTQKKNNYLNVTSNNKIIRQENSKSICPNQSNRKIFMGDPNSTENSKENPINNSVVGNFRLETNLVLQNQSLEPEVNQMISTVLEKFKDVHLTLNEDGKVAATLQTPLSTLTSTELKILRTILEHAQKHVQSLNIDPNAGTNYNKNIITNRPLTNSSFTTDDSSNLATIDLTQDTNNDLTNRGPNLKTVTIYDNFEKWILTNNESYKASFLTYVQYPLNSSVGNHDGDEEVFTPKISNVVSLRKFMNRNKVKPPQTETVTVIDMDEAIAHTKIEKNIAKTSGMAHKRKLDTAGADKNESREKIKKVATNQSDIKQTYVIMNPQQLFVIDPSAFANFLFTDLPAKSNSTVAPPNIILKSYGISVPVTTVTKSTSTLVPIQPTVMPVIQTVTSLPPPLNVPEDDNDIMFETTIIKEEIKIEPNDDI